MNDQNALQTELKELIVSSLGLEDIEADEIETEMPLFGEGLALDSIDALELGLAISKKYNIDLQSDKEEDMKEVFFSVQTLSEYINSRATSQ
jgi:acyl carrier protein